MFSEEDQVYLVNALRDSQVVLFLGAGASYGSTTSKSEKIPLGKELENYFQELLGPVADGLTLDQVGKDVRKKYGDAGLKRKLEEKFLGTHPSDDLIDLFSFRWSRCYTLNYDDTIEGIPRNKRAQVHKYYIGTDKFEEAVRDTLQIVHLNGAITRFDDGIVLSDKEFRSRIRKHTPWYEACASDYASKTFVFLGTRLDEPVFKAYVEAIEDISHFARAFLIVPDDLSVRDIDDLKELNITHQKATLSDFVQWLKKFKPATEDSKSTSPINMLSLEQIGTSSWIEKYRPQTSLEEQRHIRSFYSGVYPTWPVIISKSPVRTIAMENVGAELRSCIASGNSGIHLVIGQAGAGKTTGVMSALLDLSTSSGHPVYQFCGSSVTELERAIIAIDRTGLSKSTPVIWMQDFQIYADEIERISRVCREKTAIIVGEIRASDWSGRFLGKRKEVSKTIKFQKLHDKDYERIADAIQNHAIAPEFRTLDRPKQISRLKSSQNQLLILMIEVTKQRPFEEIIEHEYQAIQDEDAQAFLCIIGLVTMARARLSVSDYNTIVSMYGLRNTLSSCMAQLDGIVEVTQGNMLIGRHEIYVGHIIEKAADLLTIRDACLAILRSFTIYKVPFVVSAGKIKGNVLKFLMRGSFLQSIFRGDKTAVEEIYEKLEYDYQNDGHYWIQRGKFYRSMAGKKNQLRALEYFQRAVEAYDNPYAHHSLALQKLIYCEQFSKSTPYLESLMSEGVSELKRQMVVRQSAEDEYPIVALASSHPKVLQKWGRIKEAKLVCAEYFGQLQDLAKSIPHKDNEISDAMAMCMRISAI